MSTDNRIRNIVVVGGGSGVVGAGLGVAGFFEHFVLSALLIALSMAAAALLLLRNGVETRGRRLEDIQRTLAE